MRPLPPAVRNALLTAHVLSSLGWFGAVAAFLALAIVGLRSADPLQIRAAYVAMDLTAWLVIVPLCLATLVTGVSQSLVTTWGVFRHYWIVAKLVITVPASAILLLHMRPIEQLADAATVGTITKMAMSPLRVQLVANAVAALIVLVTATVLSVYKPRGLTPYGQRRLHQDRRAA